jgi:hypothetical protein
VGPMPYGITWLLMPLKDLHNPPRPIGIWIFMGPMPYGITWLLMPLKVLHNLPRSIGIFMPKSQGGKGIIFTIT